MTKRLHMMSINLHIIDYVLYVDFLLIESELKMENEVKPVQSSIPLGRDEWMFTPNNGVSISVTVERGADLLDALWTQKAVGVEFYKLVYISPTVREVRDTLTGKVEGFMYRGNHIA